MSFATDGICPSLKALKLQAGITFIHFDDRFYSTIILFIVLTSSCYFSQTVVRYKNIPDVNKGTCFYSGFLNWLEKLLPSSWIHNSGKGSSCTAQTSSFSLWDKQLISKQHPADPQIWKMLSVYRAPWWSQQLLHDNE